MARDTRVRPAAAGGRPTQTQTYDSASEQNDSRHVGTLRLRGEPRQRPGVRWAADVVDNSNMGKKKSKVCCIYHKPRAVGESSSESSSSSSSSGSESGSDSEPDNSTARMGGRGALRRPAPRKHQHEHGDGCDNNPGDDKAPDSSASDDEAGQQGSADSRYTTRRRGHTRRPSPNAYERMKARKAGDGGSNAVP